MLNILNDSHDDRVRLWPARATEMAAECCGVAAEIMVAEGLIDDDDFLRGCGIGRVKESACDEGHAQGLQIAVAHPWKLNGKSLVGLGDIADYVHVPFAAISG